MTNTATSANITQIRFTEQKTKGITFKDKAHEKFYYLYLPKCRIQDVYHKALICITGKSGSRNGSGRKNDVTEKTDALKDTKKRRSDLP